MLRQENKRKRKTWTGPGCRPSSNNFTRNKLLVYLETRAGAQATVLVSNCQQKCQFSGIIEALLYYQ